MFQFRRLPPYRYTLRTLRYSDWAYPAGFPHSEIHGSTSAFDSPWLIADCCVLRRLLVPRHSPCALCSLTIFESLVLLVKETLDDNLNCSCYPKINFTFLLLHNFTCIVQFSRCIMDACASILKFRFYLRTPNSELRTKTWWAQVDSNHRPHAYQACALTT